MDVFASSSLWEGLPTVLLESMASSVPIVATDIPGTQELIQHNVNGWLVAPRDAQAFSAGVLKVLHTPALKEELSHHALQTVENFTIASIARQYEALYEALQTTPNPR
jgi:glycosyltransferase involved in cell wall biosynthesis